MASNIFSSCTLSCWMLFIRMQGWRDKSRCLLLLRMPKHFHQWYSLCLNTFPSTIRPEIQTGGRSCTDFSTQIWKRKVTFSSSVGEGEGMAGSRNTRSEDLWCCNLLLSFITNRMSWQESRVRTRPNSLQLPSCPPHATFSLLMLPYTIVNGAYARSEEELLVTAAFRDTSGSCQTQLESNGQEQPEQ